MNLRKTQIINAARDLFIDKGFTNTSMTDIITAAQISKGTFYNHFTSKSECLIAILEESRAEATLLRNELAIGSKLADEDILARQIGVFMRINKERNLVRIFESIYHSDDKEIQKVVNLHHLTELDWLSNRLVEVHGEEVKPYSYEAAVLTFGMIHHVIRIIVGSGETQFEPERIIRRSLANIKAILPNMLRTKEVSISVEMLDSIRNNIDLSPLTQAALISEFELFIAINSVKNNPEVFEYAVFILAELQKETPKYHIIQSILPGFRQTFEKTPVSGVSKELAMHLWHYIKIAL